MQDNEVSDFNDIENRELRAYNRGAVLATIHEKYVGERGTIAGRTLSYYLSAISSYLARIPFGEVEEAKEAMSLHLEKRNG